MTAAEAARFDSLGGENRRRRGKVGFQRINAEIE
jgi:hypothetical protein